MRTDSAAYIHKQVSILALFSGALAMVAMLAWFESSGDPIALLVAGLTGLLIAIFHALTIKVDKINLTWHFGFRMFAKSVPLANVADVAPVRNRWWYGWGIRYTSHGWLYNVSGLGAVEVTRRDGKTFRLGTDEPDVLTNAIRARLET